MESVVIAREAKPNDQRNRTTEETCPDCGAYPLVREGRCYTCWVCGHSKCKSI